MRILNEKLCKDMIKIVGSENVLNEDFGLLCYAVDRFWKFTDPKKTSKPQVVVRPETTSEVLEIVRYANKYKIPVVPRGGGTGMHGAVVPLYGGIVIDMKKMNKIIEINEEGLYATVQAGITIERFEKELNKRGFRFGHEPGSAPAATLGGQISTDGFGLWVTMYHPVVSWLLGLEVVLPYGKVIRTRPTPVSSSFYNVNRLFIGAEATLGIITEADVKIHPYPEVKLMSVIVFPARENAIKAQRKIIQKQIYPALLSAYDEVRAEENWQVKAGGALMICFEGAKEVAEVMEKVALKICKDEGGEILGHDVIEKLQKDWYIRWTRAARTRRYWVDLELSAPIDKQSELENLTRATCSKYGLKVGMARYTFPYAISVTDVYFDPSDENQTREYLKFEKELMTKILKIKGSTLTMSHGTGIRLLPYMKMQHGPAILELMKKIKRVLDPNNIMNPGKKPNGRDQF